jgi:hypothetical protein
VALAFLQRQSHHELGFARLGDYCRERLGISARELQSVARVVAGLAGLPRLGDAFDRGELSWTQVRLLVCVATNATEDLWLERARGRTVRALAALVRDARGGATMPVGRRDGGDGADARACARGMSAAQGILDVLDDVDDSIDGEAMVRFRLSCPRRVRSLWRQTLDLARRVAGDEAPLWRAAETIAAEGLSAPRGEADGCGVPPVLTTAAERSDHGRATASETRAGYLDWSVVSAAIPEDIARLGRGCSALDAFALDARLRRILSAGRRIDWQVGRLLRLFADLRLERLMGFSSLARYVRERLGISPRKARSLMAVDRKAWQCPELATACESGRLSWVRALTILPVIEGERGGQWIARAREVTVRRLADEVEWALDWRDAGTEVGAAPAPPEAGARLVRPERQTCAPEVWAPCDAVITFSGPASVIGLLRAAIGAFAPPSPGAPPWMALEKLLLHVEAEWTRQPRHRDPVFARDGWRCAVPACTSRCNLHDHHLRFRSAGGDNTPENRITMCAWHHLRGIHGGTVRAWGRAPDALRWELGVRPKGPPLMRLDGDRYV